MRLSTRSAPDALAALSSELLLEDLVTPPTEDPAWDDLIAVTDGAEATADRTALIAFFMDAAVELGLDVVQVPDADEMRVLLHSVEATRARVEAHA